MRRGRLVVDASYDSTMGHSTRLVIVVLGLLVLSGCKRTGTCLKTEETSRNCTTNYLPEMCTGGDFYVEDGSKGALRCALGGYKQRGAENAPKPKPGESEYFTISRNGVCIDKKGCTVGYTKIHCNGTFTEDDATGSGPDRCRSLGFPYHFYGPVYTPGPPR